MDRIDILVADPPPLIAFDPIWDGWYGFAVPAYQLLRHFLFAIDAETAHRITISVLKLYSPSRCAHSGHLAIRVAGLDFPSPVGLAAGFDKDAEVPRAMLGLGFGFVEIGTVTPRPQQGNRRPRLFRLVEDRAVINRMGFNNRGQAAAHDRLSGRKYGGIVGVNVGANKDSTDRVADYAAGVTAMADVADYLTINISSPNTPGLRALQGGEEFVALMQALREARPAGGPPIFVKVAPDLDHAAIEAITDEAIAAGIDAIIIGNTTLERPVFLRSPHKGEAGGLSGAPLADLALERLKDFARASGGRIPLIAAGGIDSAEAAYARIRAGASLVQLYSALVYHGPGLVRTIERGLLALLDRDGFASISEAVGTG